MLIIMFTITFQVAPSSKSSASDFLRPNYLRLGKYIKTVLKNIVDYRILHNMSIRFSNKFFAAGSISVIT